MHRLCSSFFCLFNSTGNNLALIVGTAGVCPHPGCRQSAQIMWWIVIFFLQTLPTQMSKNNQPRVRFACHDCTPPKRLVLLPPAVPTLHHPIDSPPCQLQPKESQVEASDEAAVVPLLTLHTSASASPPLNHTPEQSASSRTSSSLPTSSLSVCVCVRVCVCV